MGCSSCWMVRHASPRGKIPVQNLNRSARAFCATIAMDHGHLCPLAKATEVLGERWTFLVVRAMLKGSARFNEVRREVPLMSPSLLSQRLQRLESEGIVTRQP